MKFGENLKNIRKYKKISQEVLAYKLGVSRQSVSKWENGENYPSMTNIMCLCDIFNCKINELVHDDMVDIDSLDEEIMMKVVKFKKEEQRKMKGISKFIFVVARIFKIVGYVSLSIISCLSIFLTFIICCINNNIVSFGGHQYNINISNNSLSIGDIQVADSLTNIEIDSINHFLSFSKSSKIILFLLVVVSLLLTILFLIKIFSYLERLFKNIHDNDTPFNMDNVSYIKKVSIFMFLYLISCDCLGTLGDFVTSIEFNVEISLSNYLIAIVIFSISYVFKYGYEIQLDSKGKIYGETVE